MGAKVSMLSAEEVGDLEQCSYFDAPDIQKLYWRFKRLDRDGSGTLCAEELLAVPEFAMNPLTLQLLPIFLGGSGKEMARELNFKGFVKLLSVFHERATRTEKLSFAFRVYDADGDGFIGKDDLFRVLKSMVGSHMEDEQIWQIVDDTLKSADLDRDGCLSFEEFQSGLSSSNIHQKMTLESS